MKIEDMKANIDKLPVVNERIDGELREFAKWTIHSCSMCGYPCGYMINIKPKEGEGIVFYDRGCDCGGSQNVDARTFEDMYGHYNMQTNADVRRDMEKVFGIEEKAPS